MIHHKRICKLEWKNNPSIFSAKNKEVLSLDYLRLGSAVNPVNNMLANSEELRVLLPTLVGLAPTDTGWQERISSYLHNILIEVPAKGYDLDISFTFDLTDPLKKANIEEYKKDKKITVPEGEKEEQYILNCILGLKDTSTKVKESDLYKYVSFFNLEKYVEYRYCLLSAKVANTVDDVQKSNNIEFYLTSAEEIKAVKTNKIKLRNEASNVYTKLVSGEEKDVNRIIIGGNLVSNLVDYKALDFEEKCGLLLDIIEKNPALLVALDKDVHIADKAKITMFIWKDLFRILASSSIIVDSSDPSKVIGNDITEAISFINNDINKAYMSEIEAKSKSLN